MAARTIVPGLHVIPVGAVNTFLLEDASGCTLIDAGFPDKADQIVTAIEGLGRKPSDVKTIIATHAHPDHIGSLAALKRATGAQVLIHPLDAEIAARGSGFRPMTASPGLLSGLLFRLFVRGNPSVEASPVDRLIEDGAALPHHLRAIHTPGHCAGHVALLWPQHGGVLFAADACANMLGLDWSLGYEDREQGRISLEKLAALDFHIVCFGHGKEITRDAAAKFRKRWQPVPRA